MGGQVSDEQLREHPNYEYLKGEIQEFGSFTNWVGEDKEEEDM